ncbi:MAG: pentapeptide repeat-containing protein [Leptolyngbyaceae cyanobacterium HOT.MB2.61]|nr:pentapeptide repeat-containing protein [Leptolyngbyaceae cyanobacterium HOT.MB2.61]
MTVNPNPSELGGASSRAEDRLSARAEATNASTQGDGTSKRSSPSSPLTAGLPPSAALERVPPVVPPPRTDSSGASQRLFAFGVILGAIAVMLLGWVINIPLIGLAGAGVALFICVNLLWKPLQHFIVQWAAEPESAILVASLAGFVALIGLLKFLGFDRLLALWYGDLNWEAVGALGEVFGALGQILIAILAVYIAWRQYVIEKDLTIQQNTITQQQTIDSYFQGISELVLDEEGLLEDWPQERAIAEGRTAAILSSIDAGGKAKVIRFLSRARLLTPLKRDQRLGRAILDGTGGYEEDRVTGIRVIDLGVMLAGADLSGTDLRWTDLSEANLIRANLSRCDLVKANFSRTILAYANLRGADLQATRFFYGRPEDACPRTRTDPPDYRTGFCTGAVIENADFTGAEDMSPEQRHYCCAWGGSKTRSTIPGGCEGIPNKLGR